MIQLGTQTVAVMAALLNNIYIYYIFVWQPYVAVLVTSPPKTAKAANAAKAPGNGGLTISHAAPGSWFIPWLALLAPRSSSPPLTPHNPLSLNEIRIASISISRGCLDFINRAIRQLIENKQDAMLLRFSLKGQAFA